MTEQQATSGLAVTTACGDSLRTAHFLLKSGVLHSPLFQAFLSVDASQAICWHGRDQVTFGFSIFGLTVATCDCSEMKSSARVRPQFDALRGFGTVPKKGPWKWTHVKLEFIGSNFSLDVLERLHVALIRPMKVGDIWGWLFKR